MPKLLRCRKVHSQQSNKSLNNFDGSNWRLEWRLCQNFTSLSLILSEKWAFKEHYGRAGPGRVGLASLFFLNDSYRSKMIMKFFFKFFHRFHICLNVVEVTYIWLIIGTSFTSLNRNQVYIYICIYISVQGANYMHTIVCIQPKHYCKLSTYYDWMSS